MTEKEKEDLLKKLLKNILEERLSRLEKRNLGQMEDIKIEKNAFKNQEVLVNKLCSIKIEPKKPNQNKSNNERGTRTRERKRDITPVNRATHRRNISNKKQIKNIRSMTPDVTLRKRGVEKKDNTKTDLRVVKHNNNNKNNKIPSYMMSTSSNANKNKRNNNEQNNKEEKYKNAKRSKTPIPKKHIEKKKKKINNHIENNLKLDDLKIEDMKEHVPIQEKNEEIKAEQKPEIIEVKITFDNLIQDKIIKILSSFFDKETRYNFFSCNKKLIKYIKENLSDTLTTLEVNKNITDSLSIQDQINSLKLKYPSDQFELEPPKFELSRGAVKAVELLNNENGNYDKIFHETEPNDEIIFIYRIFFQFLKGNDLNSIKDQKKFWSKASEFILTQSNGKLGNFFRDSVNDFEFSVKNIFQARNIMKGKEELLKPGVLQKKCPTTALVNFLVKDTLEFCGIILSLKKNIPSLCLRYLEYIDTVKKKLTNYIENLRDWCDNA